MPRLIRNPEMVVLEEKCGIISMGTPDNPFAGAIDWTTSDLGMDAAPVYALQPQAVTVANAGIPSYLANYHDPKIIEVLMAPMKAVEIAGSETKKGDWTTVTATFPYIETVGQVAAYGDYSNDGRVSANANYEYRQSFTFQVFSEWGDLELERAGKAKIDWASRVNMGSAKVIARFQNKSYFYGISGIENYGLLNDPGLNASITPDNGVWTDNTGQQIFTDIQKLYTQLQTQLNGNLDMSAKLRMVLSPKREAYLLTPMATSNAAINVIDFLKKSFKNLEIIAAPEMTTDSGELLYLIAPETDGQETMTCSFTEKMRAHAIVRETSSTHQKKSAGTWGTIIFRPAAVASMIGI